MPASAEKTSVPPDRLQLYEKLIASVPEIAAKSNFGAAYTAVNGNMFSMISKHGVVGLRLPEPHRADPAWPPNKEYVAVPDDLLLEIGYRYALTLRPKAAKKKEA